MADSEGFGRPLFLLGALLVAVGIVLMLASRLSWLGRLPGDLSFGGRSWRVYLPLGTSLLISVVLTLILLLFRRR
jgi:uncharacterized membrane-anchored protein